MAHSITYLPGAKDQLPEEADYDRGEFILATREAKLPYLRAQVGSDVLGGGEAILLEDEFLCWGSDELSKEIARWALHEGVVILGGNQRGQYHPLSDTQAIDVTHLHGVRRDPLGFWLLTTWRSGLKDQFRLSFDQANHPQVKPFRSTWPEIVEVQISDSLDGPYAPTPLLVATLEQLAKEKVLAVALAGREPTQHPDFFTLLGLADELKLTVRFVSKRPEWQDESSGGAWLSVVRWGYAVSSLRDWERAVGDPSIHIVLGTEMSRRENLFEFAAGCFSEGMDLVLQGFNPLRWPCAPVQQGYGHWLETCAAAGRRYVTIDALLAEEYELEFERRGLPEWLHEPQDGRRSMYLDPVRRLCGPSPHRSEQDLFPFPEGEEPIRQAFAKIDRRMGPARLQRALEVEQVHALRTGDAAKLVSLDAAMDGRCEQCGAPNATLVEQGFNRPKHLCAGCS